MATKQPDTVTASLERLDDAFEALEQHIVALKAESSQSKEIAAEGQQLVARHQVLEKSLGTLTDENRKLKHGLQDEQVQKAAVRQQAAEALSRLERSIGQLEKLAG